MALSSLLKEGSPTATAVQNFKNTKQAQKEAGANSNRVFLERKKKEAEVKKNFFSCSKYSNWLVPSHRYDRWQLEEEKRLEAEKYVENVKVRFKREHRVKCLDESFKETLVVVPVGWECGGCYSKKAVKVKSVQGILTFKKTDVEVLEFL